MNYLFLFYLISGILKTVLNHYGINLPFDITLLSGIILVSDLLFSLIKHNINYKVNKNLFGLIILMFLFYLWILISLSYTASNKFGYYKAIAFLTNIIAFSYPILSKKIKINKFIKLYVLSIIAFSIWFIPMLRQNQIQYNLFFAENTSGLYLTLGQSFGIIFVIILLKNDLFNNKKLKKGLLLISVIAMLSLGARGPMVALIFTLLIYLFLNGNLSRNLKRKISQNQIIIFFASLIFIFFLASYFIITNEYLLTLFSRALSRFSLLFAENKGNSVNVRVEHIYWSINAIFDNVLNFIFGYGFGSYNFIKTGVDTRNYPHNIFLETFVELGFIGFLLLIALFLFLFLLSKKQKHIKYSLLYVLLISMFSGSLTDMRMFFGILAVILSINKSQIKHKIYDSNN